MNIDHLTNRVTAAEYLGGFLNSGTLVLVLGAGISTSFVLPDWNRLIAAMCEETGSTLRPNLNDSAEALQWTADKIRSDHFENDDPGFARLGACAAENGTIFQLATLPQDGRSAVEEGRSTPEIDPNPSESVLLLSVTLFEKTPTSIAVFDVGSQFENIDNGNQLQLFDL